MSRELGALMTDWRALDAEWQRLRRIERAARALDGVWHGAGQGKYGTSQWRPCGCTAHVELAAALLPSPTHSEASKGA